MAQIEESVAQFLNVVESVFSGMAYLIIHRSDYKDRRLRQDRRQSILRRTQCKLQPVSPKGRQE